ncbi:hemin uptake protein HemP [Paracoccaceae bacterium]|nr:hemin uptake protein HemP [Paracoccaceae bacterium]|tara:strand:+ start:4221 stop:4409 length:189 start_codon:yes stop_codon:yes gene_type:complete
MALNIVDDVKNDDIALGDVVVEEVPTYDALELTNGGKVATITLAGKHYTLRVTKAIKLILTK